MTGARRVFGIPWYPLLIPVIPVVSLFVLNRAELSALDLARPLLVAVLIGTVAFAISWPITRSARKAALASTILILGILLYDWVYLLALSGGGPGYRDRWFPATWVGTAVLAYAAACAALRRSRRSFVDLTLVLNVFAFSVLAIAVLPAAAGLLRTNGPTSHAKPESAAAAAWRASSKTDWSAIDRPDIYLIILDAYARQDILQSRFGFDNRGFLDWLSSAGFFVASHSHANFPDTHYSLATTLNAEHVHQLLSPELLAHSPEADRAGHQYLVSQIADRYVKKSRVHELLDSAGYQFVSNDSGYRVTRRIPGSVREALGRGMTEFERSLLQITVLFPLLETTEDGEAAAMTMYESVLRDLRELAAAEPGAVPTFYFYHFLSPHFPFSFNEDGSQRLRDPLYARSAWIEDRRNLPGYLDYYRTHYPRNVAGLNRHLQSTIESILERTQREAVIIIQSDHGSSLGYVPGSTAETDIPERFGILNAVFLPEGISRTDLTERFSAVNTFPIVFGSLFGLQLPKPEDRAFMATGPLRFEDVTDRLGEPEHPTGPQLAVARRESSP